MARPSTSARRYAEAAFEIAERDGTVAQWLAGLTQVAQALADEEIVRGLLDPAVPFAARSDALTGALGGDSLPGLRNLLLLLLRRRRLEQLPQVAAEFRRLHNRREGIVEASAVSAAPLADEDVAELRRRLEVIAGGRVELTLEIDEKLIGGMTVRLGDRLIDGSVRGRLERLRNRLAATA
ncbi:MAG TPA: F0F1 ATP synthase subunit delta [Candidatus Limnocylindria bacterium]|jgi:F-type H+-transporting ATPase subunit delta|nr:F0F1 ATP synthase subunit delta [Candidatus Limnocylindria bacterium]